ncbi:hypothetical protein TcYC6_0052140 [Trypanosoma cruzi]|nr:hypothetical protein TcYC6_0052140 [Trypanosoma cruzi]
MEGALDESRGGGTITHTERHFTTVHPLNDVVTLQGLTAKYQKRQIQPFQDADIPENTEKVATSMFSEKYISNKITRRQVLQSDAVLKEVLATYSIELPIHSLIISDEVEEDEAVFSDELKADMQADKLECTQSHPAYCLYQTHEKEGGEANSLIDATQYGPQLQLFFFVEKFHQKLKSAWSSGEKVESLRIAIRVAKLLSKVAMPSCYPSVYVLVAQVLDTFGNLVTQRIQGTAAEKSYLVSVLLQKGIDAADDLIPSESVEACYNWFLKISSICELIPRVCIELSLLNCFRFMAKKARVVSEEVIRRLAMQIRGIADPLVAAHLRWYLCTRAMVALVRPGWATKSGLDQAVIDTLEALEHLDPALLEKLQNKHNMERMDYLDLFIPALQWQMDTILLYGDANWPNYQPLLRNVVSIIVENLNSPACLLLCVWRAFPAAVLLSCYSVEELLSITFRSFPSRLVSRLKLMEALCLSLADLSEVPLARAQRLAFLKAAWDYVEEERCRRSSVDTEGVAPPAPKQGLVGELIGVCGAMMQFCANHVGFKQVNVFLGLVRDIIGDVKMLENEKSLEAIKASLFGMLSALFSVVNPLLLLESEHVVTLLQQLASGDRRRLMFVFLRQFVSGALGAGSSFSPFAMKTVFCLCKIFHDDLINVVSFDELQEGTKVVEKVFLLLLKRVGSLEDALQLMCDARHHLSRFDSIKIISVNRALGLAGRFAAGCAEGKNHDETRALFMFSIVTIPAVTDLIQRFHLLALSSGMALRSGMIVIGEAALEFALEGLETYRSSCSGKDEARKRSQEESDIAGVAVHLLELGVAAPAKGEHLYAVRRLLNWSAGFDWMPCSIPCVHISLSALRLMTRALQGRFLSFPFCQTEHYGKDPAFVESCLALSLEATHQLQRWIEASCHVVSTKSELATDLSTTAIEIFETLAIFDNKDPPLGPALTTLFCAAWRAANAWAIMSGSLEVSRHILRTARFVQEAVGTKFFEEILLH